METRRCILKHHELDEELQLIHDELYRNFTRQVLAVAPDYFWKAPASHRNHHSEDERAVGGLILHVKRAVGVGVFLCNIFAVGSIEYNIIISALLIHDICKFGLHEDSGHSIKGHGEMVGQVLVDNKLFDPDLPDRNIVEILNAVATHMGRWDVPYVVPADKIGLIVHLADAISARSSEL